MPYTVIGISKAPRMTAQKLKKKLSHCIECDELSICCAVMEDYNNHAKKLNTLCDHMKTPILCTSV